MFAMTPTPLRASFVQAVARPSVWRSTQGAPEKCARRISSPLLGIIRPGSTVRCHRSRTTGGSRMDGAANAATSESEEGRGTAALADILAVAVTAAREAGQLMRDRAGSVRIKTTKLNSKDLLSEVDEMCQEVIADCIFARFPDHDFLGEEDVAAGAKASATAIREKSSAKHLWIVDPIDGTINYVMGIPLSAVSIGVAIDGDLKVGVIYDPFRDELFSAVTGRGAFLNGERIQVDQMAVTLEDAVVAGGSPPNPKSMYPCMRGTAALMPQVRTMRFLGSAAIMFAWCACGRLTAYWEADLNIWDMAAGAVLIRESGGVFSDVDGSDFKLFTRAPLCSNNEGIHKELSRILVQAESYRLDE